MAQHNKYTIVSRSAALGFHSVAHRLLRHSPWLQLINRPCMDGMLSWYWYAAAVGQIQTI